MLRAQRRDPAKAQAKCAFATNYPLANRQLRSPLILRYRMQRDKPFGPKPAGRNYIIGLRAGPMSNILVANTLQLSRGLAQAADPL